MLAVLFPRINEPVCEKNYDSILFFKNGFLSLVKQKRALSGA
jgi:hypothetical protein